MSLRSEFMADAGHAGVARLPADGSDWLAAAQQAGLVVARADLQDCRDKDALLKAIASALDFPDWFDPNWDALRDCLLDLSWLPPDGWVLVLNQAQQLQASEPESLATLLDICAEVSGIWLDDDLAFWTLVDLPAGSLPNLAELA